MKTLKTVFYILACIFISGCISGNDLNRKIYDSIFKNANKIAVVKLGESQYFYSLFTKEEINIVKKELMNIDLVNTIQLNPLNYFEEYHLLYIFPNDSKKSITILYSLNLKTMMIKERDVFPEKPKTVPKITIYRIVIPEKVIELLNAHEKKLPLDGEFLHKWPINDY